MNETREKLLQLARHKDIATMGLREIAREIGVKNPQNIKFHLGKLHDAGELNFAKVPGIRIEKSKLGSAALIKIPIKGAVSAGPATRSAEDQTNGFLSISSSLLRTRNYKDLYALRVVGTSMNQANVHGKSINDGDYAVVDNSKRSPKNGDYVIAVVDELANLKRYLEDRVNEQIVLLSESSENYMPIFVHPSDSNENLIKGTVIQVVHLPTFA